MQWWPSAVWKPKHSASARISEVGVPRRQNWSEKKSYGQTSMRLREESSALTHKSSASANQRHDAAMGPVESKTITWLLQESGQAHPTKSTTPSSTSTSATGATTFTFTPKSSGA